MITVLEADRVILVEGEDDALAFDLLIPFTLFIFLILR